MALVESAISKTKIKFRYGEPYTSEAANIQAGVNLPGAYRGGNVVVGTDSPIRSVRITTDGVATVILHRDFSSTASTVVLEQGIVTLDLSASPFVWPIPAGGVSWYVYMSIDYDVNSETSGYFGVDEIGDVPAGVVILAVVELAEGATAITSDDIKTDGSKRTKVLNKKNIIVQKLIEISAGGASTARFQLTGRVCFLGVTSEGNGKSVSLRNHSSTKSVLVDADGKLLYAGSWYAVSIGGSALDASDMDEDGCYTNPWVSVNSEGVPVTYAGAFYAAYHTVVSLDSISTIADTPGFMSTHAEDVASQDIAGSPDSLTTGSLVSQLTDLLGFVNGKIPTLTGSVSTSTWTLLWRSNDSIADLDVDMSTMSLYYSNTGMMLVRGGYVSGTNIVTENGVSGSAIYAYSISSGSSNGQIDYRIKYVSNGSNSIPISSTSSWDYYTKDATNLKRIYNYGKSYTYDQDASVTMDAVPGTGTHDSLLEILKLAEDRVRVYYSNAASDSRFIISSGCYWDESSSTWLRSSTDNQNATVVSLSRNAGFVIKNKLYSDSDFETGWVDSSSGWTKTCNLFSSITNYGLMNVSGDVKEHTLVSPGLLLNSSFISAMIDPDYEGPRLKGVVNFRYYRESIPTVSDIVFEKVGAGPTLSNYSATEIDHWGFKVNVDVDIVSAIATTTSVIGMQSTTEIYILGDGYEWSYGQLICIRNGTSSWVWMVVDFVEQDTNTMLTVDTFGGNNLVEVGIVGGTLYTISQSEENTVLDCIFRAKIY